jgi:hypothetical protein
LFEEVYEIFAENFRQAQLDIRSQPDIDFPVARY